MPHVLADDALAACGNAEAEAAAKIMKSEQSQKNDEVEELRRALKLALAREAELRLALQHEHEIHEATLNLLHEQRHDGAFQASELRQELENLSADLEQREEDLLGIQFEMVDLQNKLKEQACLCSENSMESHIGKEQLEDKDKRLQTALRRQEELSVQMNEATMKLQERITQLSKELERSHTAYRALEEQSRAVIQRIESDREVMHRQLELASKEVAHSAAQLEEARLHHAKASAESEKAIAALRAELREHISAREDAYKEVCSAEQAWKVLLAQTSSLEEQLSGLRSAQEAGTSECSELAERVRELDAERSLACEEADRRNTALCSALEEVRDLEARFQRQSGELEESCMAGIRAEQRHEEFLAEHKEMALFAEADRTAKDRLLDMHLERSASLEAEVMDANGRCQQHLTDLKQVEADFAQLQAELQSARVTAARAADFEQLAAKSDARLQELHDSVTALRRREASLMEAESAEASRHWDTKELLTMTEERNGSAEDKVADLQSALQRSRLSERQALERVQELRASLMILREFGQDDFMTTTFVAKGVADDGISSNEVVLTPLTPTNCLDEQLGAALPSVLISVEVGLGFKSATLSVATWQTRADFEGIVESFLEEHRVKPLFAEALVHYLTELDEEAKAYPVLVKAELADLYSRYG